MAPITIKIAPKIDLIVIFSLINIHANNTVNIGYADVIALTVKLLLSFSKCININAAKLPQIIALIKIKVTSLKFNFLKCLTPSFL